MPLVTLYLWQTKTTPDTVLPKGQVIPGWEPLLPLMHEKLKIILKFSYIGRIFIFFKDLINLFLERGMEGERHSVCGCLLTHPLLGTWPETQMCPDWFLNLHPLVCSPVINPLSHTCLGLIYGFFFFKYIYNYWFLEREEGLGRERGRHIGIDMREKHGLIASYTCLDRGSNPQVCGVQDDTLQPTELHWPGLIYFLFLF